jgi:hypothetical protein
MTALSSAESCGEVIQRAWERRTARKWLLRAGIGAGAVYAAGDLLSGLLYDGYSFADQAISELSAYGSPVRPLGVAFIAVHGLLGFAFCVGVWLSAGGSRALRWTAAFLFAASAVTAPLHPFFPMSSRGMETGFNDTMHIVLTMAFVPLVTAAMVASVFAFRGWFRLYAIASLGVLVVAGGLAGRLMEDIAKDLPTPWLGAFERVNAYTLFAWMAMLAVVLLRRIRRVSGPEPGGVQAPAVSGQPIGTDDEERHAREQAPLVR